MLVRVPCVSYVCTPTPLSLLTTATSPTVHRRTERRGVPRCPPYPHGPVHEENPCGLAPMPACELQPGFYSPCGHSASPTPPPVIH
jgi:hypothetical protein